MKLYTTKSGSEGIEIYVSNLVIALVLIIVFCFGFIAVNSPQEKVEYERTVICK